MNRPDFIKPDEWHTVVLRCIENSINPYLIAAIGWHETHWGRLGWGRYGYFLGVGCFSETKADESWKGLSRQLDFACTSLSKYFLFLPNLLILTSFARQVWKPAKPDLWAKAVHSYYTQYLDLYATDFYSYVPIPEFAKGTMYKLYKNKILNTPYGDYTFYRILHILSNNLNLF